MNKHLNWILSRQKENELHGLLDNPDSHLLFTVVPTTRSHEHGSQALDDGALNLLEPTLLVAASCVGDVHLLPHLLHFEVSTKRNVVALNSLVGPLAEQLWLQSVVWSFFFFNAIVFF